MPLIENREFAVKVVGESFHDDNLRELCGPANDHVRRFKKTAVLILEDNNPYDRNAVRVEIGWLTVETRHDRGCPALLISVRGNAASNDALDILAVQIQFAFAACTVRLDLEL